MSPYQPLSDAVGILTFHNGPNYGGFLQAWHLKTAIAALGFPTTIINYQNPLHLKSEQLPSLGLSIQKIKTFGHKYLKARPFVSCVADLSDHPFTTDLNGISWDRFSSIVVGSDVIWNYDNLDFGHERAFFGMLPEQNQSRFVSYAASCGKTDGSAVLPEYVQKGLQRFTTHLVRDENTAAMVKQATGHAPPLVVDPTWLQNDPEIRKRFAPSKPYVLLYGGGLDPARAIVLRRYCDLHGLKLISAAMPCKLADKVFRSINPFEWVDLFRHAQAVVTSTLHGTLYTIKYGKPLLLMNNIQTQNKARTVIARSGLEASVIAEGQPFEDSLLAERLSARAARRPPADWIADSRKALAAALA
jgi:hypothetical protein